MSTSQDEDERRKTINESIFSRDTTDCTVSMSERDLERLVGRVAELEILLRGKEATVRALNNEMDHLRAETSLNSSNSSSTKEEKEISLYRAKLEEFEKAISQRDTLIDHLTTSLEQALSAKDDSSTTEMTNLIVVDNMNLQQKDLALNNETEITNIKDKYEERIRALKDDNKMLSDRLNKELSELESKHAKELSVFQTQLAYYKKTVEALRLDLKYYIESLKAAQSEVQLYKSKLDEARSEAENARRMQNLHFQEEKELLNEQIKLHKIQLEDITSKHIATKKHILESKESVERSLEQALSDATALKLENDALKFQLDDLSCRYSAAQSMIENNQTRTEKTLSSRVFELEMTQFNATSVSAAAIDLGETMYKIYDDKDLKKQSLIRQQLLVEKIRVLETENASCKKDLYEMTEKAKKLEEQCEQLTSGLTRAWNQCAEFEEKFNQSAAVNESGEINASLNRATSSKLEPDETYEQICVLPERLKEREKETDTRTSLEIKEMSLISDTELKKSEEESESKVAMDKIWRDTIADLEKQLQTKTEKERSLHIQINNLEIVIDAQTKNQQELVQELEVIKCDNEHLKEQINHLQEELTRHKLNTERFNLSVLNQMEAELHEVQNQLDIRTRQLESVCTRASNPSRPSEEVSIGKQQIDNAAGCLAPDDPSSLSVQLLLDQILRLKNTLLKHAREEDAVFEEIGDLEARLRVAISQNEELLVEQEILHQTASERLFQIEAMRGRLEQHKQSAPFAEKQAISRLEVQLHKVTAKSHSLEQVVTGQEIELKELRAQLERANRMLTEKEAEMENRARSEDGALQTKHETQLELPQPIDSNGLGDDNRDSNQFNQSLQNEFRETIENLTQDKNFYKSQYESAQMAESQMRKNLEEMENILKLRETKLDDCKEKIRVNENIITELNAENTKLKREIEVGEKDRMKKDSISLLQESVQELKSEELEKDIAMGTSQTRDTEIENENKQLACDFEATIHSREITDLRDEIVRLRDSLNNRDRAIRELEEMLKRTSDPRSGASSPLSSEEIRHPRDDKDDANGLMSDDSKSLHRTLETSRDRMKEWDNAAKLRRKLSDECGLKKELRETMLSLQDELEYGNYKIAEYENVISRLRESDLTVNRILELDNELASERNTVKCLRMQIEQHRYNTEMERSQNMVLNEVLQNKLEAFLKNKIKLCSDLMSMKQQCINLDSQLSSMRELIEALKAENASQNLSDSVTITAQHKSESENSEEEKNVAELRENLKKLESEISKYEKELEIVNKKQESLINRMLVNDMKKIVEVNRCRTEEELKAREQELKRSSEREAELTCAVESLRERAAELDRKKEKEMKELFDALRSSSESAVKREDETLPGAKGVPGVAQKNKELIEKIEKCADEKSNPEDKVCEMRNDKDLWLHHTKQLEDQLTVSFKKLRIFYGKYLRVDSRRKALAFQKNYLLCIVRSYQYSEASTLCVLAQLTEDQRSYTQESRSKMVRFRIAVFAIISIQRMKWLIKRWRIKKCAPANAIMDSIDQVIDLSSVRNK